MPLTPEQQAQLPHCPFCGRAPRYLEKKEGFYVESAICDTCHVSLPPAVWSRRAQVKAQEAQVDAPTITLNFERPRMWHMDCKVSHLGGNVCKTISHDPANSLVECRACGKRGRYPVGAVGERVVAEAPGVPAQTGADQQAGGRIAESRASPSQQAALQELADQAQELGMGYGPVAAPLKVFAYVDGLVQAEIKAALEDDAPVASPPGSALHGEPSWRTADISWACAHLTENTLYSGDKILREWNAMKAIAIAAEAALSQPVQAVPDARLPKVREALETYYKALTARLHGGSAQADAIYSIEQVMGMTWMDWCAAQSAESPSEPSQ